MCILGRNMIANCCSNLPDWICWDRHLYWSPYLMYVTCCGHAYNPEIQNNHSGWTVNKHITKAFNNMYHYSKNPCPLRICIIHNFATIPNPSSCYIQNMQIVNWHEFALYRTLWTKDNIFHLVHCTNHQGTAGQNHNKSWVKNFPRYLHVILLFGKETSNFAVGSKWD